MRLSPEHAALRDTVRRFVATEIEPHAEEWEQRGEFPAHDLFPKLGRLGLLGISKPEAYGGLGLDFSYEMILAEELGNASTGGVPMAIGVQSNMATPALAQFGSDELREEFLRPAITGEYVASIAVSEPQAGSDVSGIETRATLDGGDYVVNGTKMWITNGAQADFYCVLANTSNGDRHHNKSLLIVPSKLPGVSHSQNLDKLGMRSSDTVQVFFDNVRIPVRYRVGDEGAGFRMQMMQFQDERLYGSAGVLRALERCIDETAKYCGQRMAFGKTVLENQVVQFRLGELKTEIEALRALLYHATDEYVAGNDVTLLASMAKLKAGRLGREVTDSCLQYWGGMGYMNETLVTRIYRDMRLVSIGAGSDEMMLGIIAKLTGLAR
jgi:citronellyl-CoA dehydrogenase